MKILVDGYSGCGCALLITLAANSAFGTLTYRIDNDTHGMGVVSIAVDGGPIENVLAGAIEITQVSQNADVPQHYTTLCVDLGGVLYLGHSYTYREAIDFAGNAGLQPGWGAVPAAAGEAIQNAAQLFNQNYSVLKSGSTVEKAALQLAVWSALYNTDAAGQLTGTRLSYLGTSAAIQTQAASYLSTLNDSWYSGGLFVPDPAIRGAGSQNNPYTELPPQGLLFRMEDLPPGGITPVPEPTTFIAGLGALGLLALAVGTHSCARGVPIRT